MTLKYFWFSFSLHRTLWNEARHVYDSLNLKTFQLTSVNERNRFISQNKTFKKFLIKIKGTYSFLWAVSHSDIRLFVLLASAASWLIMLAGWRRSCDQTSWFSAAGWSKVGRKWAFQLLLMVRLMVLGNTNSYSEFNSNKEQNATRTRTQKICCSKNKADQIGLTINIYTI